VDSELDIGGQVGLKRLVSHYDAAVRDHRLVYRLSLRLGWRVVATLSSDVHEASMHLIFVVVISCICK
jgi:hypothetical protein